MRRIGWCVGTAILFEIGTWAAHPSLPSAIRDGFRIGGAPGGEQLRAIGVDGAGNVYLGGVTYGGVFPFAHQAIIGPLGGPTDLFVVKVAAATRQVQYVTAIGGSNSEQFGAMAVDRAGNVYLAGGTTSVDFPTTSGSFQARAAQGGAFLLKLDPSGQQLIYSTYLDDSDRTSATALVVDTSGNAYIAGGTDGHTFPTTAGAYRTSAPTGSKLTTSVGFVSKIDPPGKALLFSTLFGGSIGFNPISALALDASGKIQIAGSACSPNFPTTPDAVESASPRLCEAFFARLDPVASTLLYSTLVPNIYGATELKTDAAGNAYLLGDHFAADPSATAGAGDISITKIDVHGPIAYSQIFGGAGIDAASALLVLNDGTVMIGGGTQSADFPTRDTLEPCAWNLPDPASSMGVFLMLDPSGTLTFSTLLGGGANTPVGSNSAAQNSITAAAVAPDGSLFLSGNSLYSDFPGNNLFTSDSLGQTFTLKLDLNAVVHGQTTAACVVQGATFSPAPVSPGVIATLYGSNLGPSRGLSFALDANGKVPPSLAGMQVMVAGIASPLLYAQDRQINFIVPQAVAIGTQAQICVVGLAGQSCLYAPVLPVDPGIFKLSSGYAIVNQDGSINSAVNPAFGDSIVSLYGTGLGPYDLNIPDGSIAPLQLAHLTYLLQISVIVPPPYPCPFVCPPPKIVPAEIEFAGAAPTLVNGVNQINLKVPSSMTAGAYTLAIQIESDPKTHSTASASAVLWVK